MVKIDKKHVVYKITNTINNKIYIGMTGNLETRWSGNGTQYRPRNNDTHRPFWNAINKYGWDNFKKEILEDKLTFEEAIEGEIFYIAFFDSTNKDIGYNVSPGGNGGRIYLEHPKGMLGKKHTDEVKEKHSLRMSGENNPFYGKKHDVHPKGMLGKPQTEKQKNTARGNKYSCKKIVAKLPNGETKDFESLNDCAKFLGLSPTSSVILNLLKKGNAYVCSNAIKTNRAKYLALEGLMLKYVS